MKVQLGCGQITWRHSPEDTQPEEEVLGEIASAGYVGAPWMDAGRSADEIRSAWQRHNLAPAPGYMWGDFWDPSQRTAQIEQARRNAQRSQELGLTEIYVAAGGFDDKTRTGSTRREVVAHSQPDDSLTDEQYEELIRTLQAVGEATLEFGVRACYHNHGGTFIEREDELQRLLDAISPEVLFLGVDTGHFAWAGGDVVDFARRHGDRIKTMHLKDVNAEVRAKGAAEGWDYATFEENGIWTEVGSGSVDFAGLFGVLSEHDFDGWLIVETDVTQLSSAAESAKVSRENLRSLGI
ncbi:sugar phosphate isomerase/epimerase family protein [Gryllotalpicola reticulitermitis]|uniref:Sugar phosphate isomerase/epimerase family protein n=1 Tax=Gryllotalpicola reticulitermitis TaxID=1184153 RepID=A0ABV8Q4G2_9MICO